MTYTAFCFSQNGRICTHNFNPDDMVTFALPASQLISVHRGGEMLSSCEAPQVSDLFAANAELTFVKLPPTLPA